MLKSNYLQYLHDNRSNFYYQSEVRLKWKKDFNYHISFLSAFSRKMKQLISFVVMTVLLSSNCLGRSISSEPDNSLSANSVNSVTYEQPRDWVKISRAPPARITQVRGTTIELECEVMGSPTPIVQWVHGSGQMIDVS